MNMTEHDKSFFDITQNIESLYEEYAKSRGLTYISMTVLECIYESADGCTQKDICEMMHYPKQSVNVIITSFLKDGLIELRELATDRRNKRIVFTDKGKAYADEILSPLWKVDTEATEALTEDEQAEMLHLMRIYESAYSERMAALIKNK